MADLDDNDLELDEHEEVDVDEGEDEHGGEEAGHERREDDRQEDDASEDDGQEGQAEVGARGQREPGRAERRILREREQRQAAERRAEEAERRAREVEQRLNPPRNEEAEFQQRIAQMEPWEREQAIRERDQHLRDVRMARLEIQLADQNDRAAFDRLSAKAPVLDKVRDTVETRLSEIRARGGNATREQIAYFEIGRQAVERAQRGAPKAARTRAAAVDRQAARPGASRSDVPAEGRGRSDTASARAARLASMEI